MDPDLDLLDRWCAGDLAAGNELFTRHFDSVYRFFESKAGAEMEELVQETFLACVRRRDEFRRQSTFRTFLFAIARFELYRYWRRRARDGEALDFSAVSLEQIATSPRSRMARHQDRERLLHALRSLPLESQLLLELHYWEGLDSEKLAEVFAVEPVTARTRLFRARQMLRERMAEAASGSSSAPSSPGAFDDWVASLRGQWAELRRGSPDAPD